MTKEQFLTLYQAFVILGHIPSPAMYDSAIRDVRKANDMIWYAICGCDKEKSIAQYAAEIGVSDEEIERVRLGK